jgi:hypothetical protein
MVDRAYIINEGQVLKEGSPLEIIHDHLVRQTYLGDNFLFKGEGLRIWGHNVSLIIIEKVFENPFGFLQSEGHGIFKEDVDERHQKKGIS